MKCQITAEFGSKLRQMPSKYPESRGTVKWGTIPKRRPISFIFNGRLPWNIISASIQCQNPAFSLARVLSPFQQTDGRTDMDKKTKEITIIKKFQFIWYLKIFLMCCKLNNNFYIPSTLWYRVLK